MMIPGKISGFLSGVINQLIDCARSSRIASSATIKANVTPHGTTLELTDKMDSARFKPFHLSVSGDDIRVEVGNWTRLGTKLSLTPDADKTFYTISSPGNPASGNFASSTTYYVYLQLEHSTSAKDPALNPDEVNVYADTAAPADTATLAGNKIMVLGTATTDTDGVFKQPNQSWTGGHIDDIAVVPDANSQYNADPDFRYDSISYRTSGALHEDNLQLHDWDNPTPAGGFDEDNDLMMFQDVSEDNKPLSYIKPDDMVVGTAKSAYEADRPSGDWDDGDWEGQMMEWHGNYTNPATAGGAPSYTALMGYWTGGADPASGWYQATAADIIGNNTFWPNTTIQNPNDKTYETTGAMHANDIYVQDRTANHWGDNEIDIDVTSACDWDIGGALDFLVAGNLDIATTSGYMVLNSGDYATIQATNDVNIDGDDVNFLVNTNLTINSNTGQSGTLTLDDGANWRITLTFTHGILTGQTTGASSSATASWA